MSKKVKLMGLVLLAITLVLVIGGCKSVLKQDGPAVLKLAIEVAEKEEKPSFSVQTVSDEIQLDKFIVTIGKGEVTHVKEVAATGNAEVVFDSIESGDWQINVVAKDVDGYDCYAGSKVATVLNGLTTVDVQLYLLNGDLDLEVILPTVQGTTIAGGKVTLVNPRAGQEHVIMDLTMGATAGTANFGSVKAGTWFMEVELYDPEGTVIAWGSTTITVLPSRNNHAIIEFDQTNLEGGALKVRIIVNLSPADPTGLTATVQNNQVVLNWTANPESNIAGYTVYRATSETGFKKILTYSLISETTYTDTTVEIGKTYYYWVQAYNTDDYASDLSSVASVFVSESVIPTNGLDLTKYNRVIYVDDTGSDETGDGSAANPYKNIDTAIYAAIDGDLVFIAKGTYRLRQMVFDSTYEAAGFSFLKKIDIIGEDGKEVILNWYGADSSRRDGPVFGHTPAESTVARFTVNFYPGKDNGFNDCGSSIWRFSQATFKNINVNVKYTGIKGIYQTYNNPPAQKPWVENCTISWEAGSYGMYWESAQKAHYVNCLFNVDASRESQCTKDHSVVRTVTSDDLTGVLAADLVNAGVRTNPDGTTAHIGVYGGEYAWGTW